MMSITIEALIERGYIRPDNNPRRFNTAYRWTGLGQVNCVIWVTPEHYVDDINHGYLRHCIHCLRSMYCKPAAQKDPTNTTRTVCRGCYADGKRLEPVITSDEVTR